MKKIFTSLLSILIIFNGFLPSLTVKASEQLTTLSTEECTLDGEVFKKTQYLTSTGVIFVLTNDHRALAMDSKGNIKFDTYYEIEQTPDSNESHNFGSLGLETLPSYTTFSLVDDYDVWNSPVYSKTVIFKPGQYSWTSSPKWAVIWPVVFSVLTGNAISLASITASAPGSVITGIIEDAIDGGYNVSVGVRYIYNHYCNVLRKEALKAKNSYGENKINWLENPNDYEAVPEAKCRILAQRYW